MKAELVYNKKDEPRLLLQLETAEEKILFNQLYDLDLCVTNRSGDGELMWVSYSFAPIPGPDDEE